VSYPIPAAAMPAATGPGRVGQSTAVEQSRAVAEVQAAIYIAQQCPRSTSAAIAAMQESCGHMALAEKAFFRYSRGGSQVSGPTIHLAKELARVWGNVQYGISELRRDDEYGQSEMQSWAWDLQTNARNSNTFIVQHVRDTKNGPKKLTDQRDLYENNANNGARRLREAIFTVLPLWFVESAKDLCTKTLESGGGKPLPERIAGAIRVFGEMGITLDQLVQKLGGRNSNDWTAHDVAQLTVIYKSIRNGEVSKDDEFPQQRVTADELTRSTPTGTPAAPQVGAQSAADDPWASTPVAPIPNS